MVYGILVTIDMSKYSDYKAIFLHKVDSMNDILTYNPDISTYFSFSTIEDAQAWFAGWVILNREYTHIPIEYFKITEILPGINTRGYLPGTDSYRNNLEFNN